MPPIESAMLVQRAVLWAYVRDDKNGEPVVDAPIEIKCRLNHTRNVNRDAQASPTATSESVAVDREIPESSIMYLGTLEDVCGTGTGMLEAANLRIVSMYNETPDIKGREVQRNVTLERYRKSLPTIDPQ